MKAWEDLERDPYVSLYWTGDDLDPDSHWYMDHGVKIEKFKDGRIEQSEVKSVTALREWFNETHRFLPTGSILL